MSSDIYSVSDSKELLEYIVSYITTIGAGIKPNETMNYGYWLIKFVEASEGFLDIWEYKPDGSEFILGATQALTYWREQHDVCSHNNAQFTPPIPDRLVVISEGLLDGEPVDGVRYSSPPHMSGWWFFTDRYNNNANSLVTEHLYHITAARPDLAKFIALPHGFRFSQKRGDVVYFDEEAISRHSGSSIPPPAHG